jgi:gliding motility-associated-like protein
MFGPQVALYQGPCDNLTEIACAADFAFTNNLPLIANDLVVGQQYYIRVDAFLQGSFQICLQNREVVNVAQSDCPNAMFVCSKDPLVLEAAYNAGNDALEMEGAPCLVGFTNIETCSAWFVFTAADNGTLEFTITPTAPADDLDFILYRLPNGPGDCTGKQSVRCMAAGDFTPNSPCMGPTGLNATATDFNQPAGCAPGMDNFLRFLNMQAGTTYALVVNNFTSIGNGFTIEWGGTGRFLGDAKADMRSNLTDQKLCLGEELVLTDSSKALNGEIVGWKWDFGAGAIPASSSEEGPHTVQYQTPGPKVVILNVFNKQGCAAADTIFFLVEVCCIMEVDVAVEPGCPDEPTAVVTATVTNGLAPIKYVWSTGESTPEPAIKVDASGTYSVTVYDSNGCSAEQTFVVNTPKTFSATFPKDTTIILGQTVNYSVGVVPSPPTKVLWTVLGGNDVSTSPTVALSPADSTTYIVKVESNGCEAQDTFTIRVIKPRFDMPNAFTPNGDGANDTFGPVNIGHTFLKMEVWSRWGEKIYDSDWAGNQRWDGTVNGSPAPSDVYVFRIHYKLPDGTEAFQNGDVTLLR